MGFLVKQFQTLKKLHRAVLLLIIWFLTSNSYAQNALGLKLSGNYNYLGYSFEEGYGDRFGYGLGAFGLIELAPLFYLKPEINYSYKSIDLYDPFYIDETWSGNNLRVGLSYIEIPVNFGYGAFIDPVEPGKNPKPMLLFLYGGPSFSYLNRQQNELIPFRSNSEPERNVGDIDMINKVQLGFNLGVTMGTGNFYFDARYYLSLSRFLDYKADGNNLSSITLSVGYMLKFQQKKKP
jgi:hypothetical protein